jgi:hypothetical protein
VTETPAEEQNRTKSNSADYQLWMDHPDFYDHQIVPYTVWVDFNLLWGSGPSTTTLVKYHRWRTPRVGDWVICGDDEGNRCLGTITWLNEVTLVITLNMQTFVSSKGPDW